MGPRISLKRSFKIQHEHNQAPSGLDMIRLLCIPIFLLAMMPVWATEFAVSPMLIDFKSRPGTRESFEISVMGKQPGKIMLSTYAMTQQESGHMSFVESGFNPEEHKAVNWIRFEHKNYELLRDETTIIRGVIEIPRNERGTYLAAVMIEEVTGPSTANISIKVRYAVILNINISHPSGRLKTAFDSLNLFDRDGVTFIEGYFTNQNPFMGMLDSQVQIRDRDRRLVARLSLKTESAWQRGDKASRVYPGARVKVVARLKSGPPSGDYNILVRNKLSGKGLPIYRQEIAYRSSLRREPDDFELLRVTPERIIVSPRRSGLSYTSIAVSNNLDQSVSIDLPEGTDRDAGIEYFEFIPSHILLKPGMRQHVLLKQRHLPDIEYPGRKFVLAATFESGDQHALVITTFAEKS